jgi:hypothetical protein
MEKKNKKIKYFEKSYLYPERHDYDKIKTVS